MRSTAPSRSRLERLMLPFVEGSVKSTAKSPTSGTFAVISSPGGGLPRRSFALVDTDEQWVRFHLRVRRLLSPVRACNYPRVPDDLHSGSAAPDSDAARVAEMATGSTEALAALYDSHAAPMFALAQRVLGDRRDAEDLVHDVFLEAWRRASAYDPARGSVRSWLLVRVRSRALDRRRALEVAQRHASGDAELARAALPRHPELDLIGNVTRARALEA